MTQPRSGAAKPIQPASVNRELDGLRTILNKAVEWGKLLESPARNVKRLKVDNRRTRILTDDEQRAILGACPRKLRAIVLLALITGARIGELLALRWADCEDGFVPFWETKNGKVRRIPISPAIKAVLDLTGRGHNAVTKRRNRWRLSSTASEIAKWLKEIGGRQGDRTPDLCIANAALSQLS